MARKIEYNPVDVKQTLMALFWRKGYAETSLSDLEAASGLNRRQLYNGLGDKRAMFLQALDDFCDMAGRQFLAPLEREEAGVGEIRALLDTFLKFAAEAVEPTGCMICSTAQDEIAGDGDVKARIDRYFDRIRAAYANAVVRAQARGELSPGDPEPRVDALFGTHVALCVLARAGRPQAQLTRMVAQAMEDLR